MKRIDPPPISPPSGPTHWLFQKPPAKSKFLAAGGTNAGAFVWRELDVFGVPSKSVVNS